MEHILELAEKNRQQAWEVIRKTDVMNIWKSVGAEINLVGSLNMGLLVKNRDVDFHIYSSPLTPAMDCIVRCSGPYSLLQWTVQSAAGDCNNLPFKRSWLSLRNGLFLPLFVI